MPSEIVKNPEASANVNPYNEYVVGGVLGVGLGNASDGITLSQSKDTRHTPKLYEEMMDDPKISKCVNLLKIAALGEGVELAPSVADTNPEYDTALMVSEFCSAALRNLEKPLRETLFEMLDAAIYGYKIAEIVYEIKSLEIGGKKYLLPKRIKPKNNKYVNFVVDRYMNVIGFSFSADINSSLLNKTFSPINSASYLNNEIEITVEGKKNKFVGRNKFMVFSLWNKDSDPRGVSLLKSAVSSWMFKKQIITEYLRYLLTCSMPLLVGFTPETEEVPILRNPDGSPMLDGSGRPIRVNREAALRDALVQARNASAIALKGGSEIKEIGGQGSGLAFYKALEIVDSQIEGAIILQTLAVSEGRYQTRAASQVHMSVLDQFVFWVKGAIAQMIETDLLKPIITMNLGKEYLKYMPKISLGDTERRDFSVDASAIASLYSAGYLSEDQKRYTDLLLGLPPRDSNYDPTRTMTPNEVLQMSRAVLEQSREEAEIKKLRQAANTDRVKQLVELHSILSESGTDTAYLEEIKGLIDTIIQDTSTDVLNQDEDRILRTLVASAQRANRILYPSRDTGNEDASVSDPVDSKLLAPPPSSGSLAVKPYISVGKKPASI